MYGKPAPYENVFGNSIGSKNTSNNRKIHLTWHHAIVTEENITTFVNRKNNIVYQI